MRNRFHDLTIGQKLNIGFGILVLLLLLIVGLIFAAGQAATNRTPMGACQLLRVGLGVRRNR